MTGPFFPELLAAAVLRMRRLKEISSGVRPTKELSSVLGHNAITVHFSWEFTRIDDALRRGCYCLQGMALMLNGAEHLRCLTIAPPEDLNGDFHGIYRIKPPISAVAFQMLRKHEKFQGT